MARVKINNNRRLKRIFFVFLACIILLVLRVGYWSLIAAQDLNSRAEGQWTRKIAVSPIRGTIYDRNSSILASSSSANTVVVRPKEIAKSKKVSADDVADFLATTLNMDKSEILKKAKDSSKSETYIKRLISEQQAKTIDKKKMDGVALILESKRSYPGKTLLSQTLGFTTIDGMGLEGLEKKFDEYLAGQGGKILAETDANGRVQPGAKEIYTKPRDGYSLITTIDLTIQSFLDNACADALEANGAKSAYGIVMDPQTSEILAMSVNPGYDLNNPPRNDAKKLQELSRNKIILDAYEPGSTFKIITTASALDSEAASLDSHYNCPGFRIVDGQKIKCWRSYRPHGSQTLTEAVENSCNPAFMDMALAMGKETFYKYMYNFGFGQNTGIDFSSDASGIVRNQKYVVNVDLARIGFGQSVAVTPLQLMNAVSAVINGGELHTPSLAKQIVDDETKKVIKEFKPEKVRQVISPETSAKMREILESVVKNGSGKNGAIPGYRVGGKTGTAQKYKDGAILEGKNISSFIAFAPADNPKYLVMVVVDEPATGVTFGSVVAAPYVKDVLEQTLKYANVKPTESELVEYVTVPDLVDKPEEQIYDILKDCGLVAMTNGTGTVLSQTPAPNTKVKKGSSVILEMSKKMTSENACEIPDLSGLTIADASVKLREAGLRISVSGNGYVKTQMPSAGEFLNQGEVVKVECSPEQPESSDEQNE